MLASGLLYDAGTGYVPFMLTGYTGSEEWQKQGPGSLSAAVEGWLLVDYDGASIQFMPGSQITFCQTNLWQPGSHGHGDALPANFAGKFTDGIGIFTEHEELAVRNLTLNLSSDRIPVVTGDLNFYATRFDASQIQFTVAPGFNAKLDYFYNGLVLSTGSISLGGRQISNHSGWGGQPAVGVPEITGFEMPLDLSLTLPGLVGGETSVEFTGMLGFSQNIISPSVLIILINYPEIPNRVTLMWDPRLHLMHSPSLEAPKWAVIDAVPPYDVPLKNAAGFYRTN